MLSVFEKIFKRPPGQPVGNRLPQPAQAGAGQTASLKTSQDELIPGTEIMATELASHQSNDLSRDIIFIDGAVDNISHLLRELDPAADLYVLHLQSDGLEQIADYLMAREKLLAVHIFCNGGPDFLSLGSQKLAKDNLSRIQLASLMRIGAALTEQSDVLIYGCELGANDAGAELISNLSEIIGADIAVSPQVSSDDEKPPKNLVEEPAMVATSDEKISPNSIAEIETADPAIVGKTNGANGTVVFDLTGNITYVADPGFYGEDSFEYKVETGGTIEQVKVHVNIMPEDEAADAEPVSQFNIVAENLLTSVSSSHRLSLAEGEFSPSENCHLELTRAVSDSDPSTLFINLQKWGGEGSPSFKIAVAPADFVPSTPSAAPLEKKARQETAIVEAVVAVLVDELVVNAVTEMAEPEATIPEIIVEITPEETTDAPLQFEDFCGGTLHFPFDPQLQEPELTGNSILGQLIVDTYVRPGTIFLDVNNSFDPKEQGVVSHYLVKQADGSPLPEQAQTIRDGFIAIDQNKSFNELDLLIEAELLDGHIVSRTLRVNMETGGLEALTIKGASENSRPALQAPISVGDGVAPNTSASINH